MGENFLSERLDIDNDLIFIYMVLKYNIKKMILGEILNYIFSLGYFYEILLIIEN